MKLLTNLITMTTKEWYDREVKKYGIFGVKNHEYIVAPYIKNDHFRRPIISRNFNLSILEGISGEELNKIHALMIIIRINDETFLKSVKYGQK